MEEYREVIARIEALAATEVGRGSAMLAEAVVGELDGAARSICAVAHPVVWIFSGFYLPRATPATAETDGPVGAAQLAASVIALGGSARIVTDELCAPVLRAACDAAGVAVPILSAPIAEEAFTAWLADALTLAEQEEVTHLLSIERVGPNADGTPCNMRAQDIRAVTAPLERLFLAGDAVRVAIGDGGNEIGMGRLPQHLVESVVADGARLRCVTGADWLIVGGTSNWGAQALVAALALNAQGMGKAALPRDLLAPAWSKRVLEGIVGAGAADGVTLVNEATVDGLDWDDYAHVLRRIEACVLDCLPDVRRESMRAGSEL